MRKLLTATGLVVALGLLPAHAHAQAFLTPMVGATFGHDAPATKLSTGVGLAFLGKAAGLELELGYTPDFFNQQTELALIADSNVTSGMANILIGPAIGRVRAYGLVGAGVLRSRIHAGDLFDAVDTNDTAVDAGGGVIVMISDHVGVRGDLRYFRSLKDPSNDGNLDVTLGNFDFWRATAGLSLKF